MSWALNSADDNTPNHALAGSLKPVTISPLGLTLVSLSLIANSNMLNPTIDLLTAMDSTNLSVP